jgi:hypothetical protein
VGNQRVTESFFPKNTRKPQQASKAIVTPPLVKLDYLVNIGVIQQHRCGSRHRQKRDPGMRIRPVQSLDQREGKYNVANECRMDYEQFVRVRHQEIAGFA